MHSSELFSLRLLCTFVPAIVNMAYRQMDIKAPSYLEDFLDQIELLPSQIKGKFAEMREMDERANMSMSDAERAAADSIRKATSKGTSNETLKKAYQEVISLQGKAVANANRKVATAEKAFEMVDDVIRNLDEKLREYEAQLRKEGRWPASTADRPPRPATSQNVSAGNQASAGNQHGALISTRPTGTTAGAATQKSRRRESASHVAPARTSAGGAGAAQSSTNKLQAQKATNSTPDMPVSVIEDMAVDPDEPTYCYCRHVSYGEMVECEATGCPYGWFHFQCVGLTEAPKGSWRCPDCEKTNSRRKADG